MLQMHVMQDGKRAVNARELHSGFNLRTNFPTWFKARVAKFHLVNGLHYEIIPNDVVTSGRPRKDYLVSLHTAIGLAFRENSAGGDRFLASVSRFQESAPAPQLQGPEPTVLTPPGLGTPYTGAPPVTRPGDHNA